MFGVIIVQLFITTISGGKWQLLEWQRMVASSRKWQRMVYVAHRVNERFKALGVLKSLLSDIGLGINEMNVYMNE